MYINLNVLENSAAVPVRKNCKNILWRGDIYTCKKTLVFLMSDLLRKIFLSQRGKCCAFAANINVI